MAFTELPTRFIICVDGTYCTPDGPDGTGYGNISNIYRLCTVIKEGKCYDHVTQQEFIQKKEYVMGIGSADDIGPLEKLKAGALGHGYKTQIKDVYEKCCKLEATDEIWLYGFSRGAYVVRAVAGLLNHMGSLKSAGGPHFKDDYSEALKVYSNRETYSTIGPGQTHSFFHSRTKPAAKIQFIGVFDTVKALDDEDLHDISFNDSVQHFRHALALNEDRKAMTPEYVFPEYNRTQTQLLKRSFVQAWFIGAHIDMGGSAKKDGLALYPLQWILIESKYRGLILEYSTAFDIRARLDNPLHVVFPQKETDGRGRHMWTCTTKNEIKVSMQDLRNVHELEAYESRYSIKLNSRKGLWWPRKTREPFNTDGTLRGYCIFGPQGTIVHPSVYMLLDNDLAVALTKVAMPDRDNIERLRPKILGETGDLLNVGFWMDREASEVEDLKFIRILVCGDTGVGKSTLINRVFGVSEADEVTKTSHRSRGIHDVRQEIIHKDRSDLILHDSGGFETGDESQIKLVVEFLKEKASQVRLEDRLHVIWFCIEMNSARTRQTATGSLFRAVSTYAADVPIIIVATKMDQFHAIQRYQAEERFAASTEDQAELSRRCKAYATEQLQERMLLVEQEMQEVGRFDGCVCVAKDDKESIKRLNDVTVENVNHEKIRILYIAAQVANIDIKVDCAIIETMKVYRKVIGTASGLAALPTAPTTNRTAGAVSVCKEIVKCFGLPTVTYQTIFEIIKSTIWDDMNHNLSVAFAEGMAVLGILGTVAFAGIPFFLAAGTFNIPLVVPATSRLMLMLAGDLILILTRAFRETTFTCIGQPLVKDVEQAACRYRPFSNSVHQAILKLVPKRNLVKSYRYNAVQAGLKEVVHRHKQQLWDAKPSLDVQLSTLSFRSEANSIDMEVEEMEKDIKVVKDEATRKQWTQ